MDLLFVFSIWTQSERHVHHLENHDFCLGQEDVLERAQQPTPVLPGESHGQRSLVGCNPYCHKELDTTEST